VTADLLCHHQLCDYILDFTAVYAFTNFNQADQHFEARKERVHFS